MTAGGIDVERSTGAGVSGYRAAIHAFSAIAEASAGEHDLDVLLHHVGREICALLGVRRCSVYLRDDSGIFRGQIGHADHDIDAKVKRLVAGVEADGFTREIVATRRPVFVQDTTTDPRPIRSTMREWRVRAMLGVPMIVGGETIGILFLDNEDEPHGYAEEEQELAATFANLAAVAIRQAQLTSKLRESLRLVGRQNYALRRAAEVDAGLTRLVLEGADLRQIVEAISQLTGKPWAIYDAQFRRLADAALPSHGKVRPLALEPGYRECAAVTEALETLRAARTAIVSPDRRSGLQHRHLVAAVTARDETWGYLVTMDYGSRLEPLDRIVADRAATMVALELSAARRAALARSDELESLASDLIRGDADAESLERRASFIGVRLAAPHALCFVKSRGAAASETPAARRLAAAISAETGTRVLATRVAEGVVAIVELDDERPAAAIAAVKQRVVAACRALDPAASFGVAVSSVCRGPGDYADAFASVGEIMRCLETFGGEPLGVQVLAADDLGAARLLLASSSRSEATRFAQHVLGPLLDDPEKSESLLETLARFIDCSASVRRTAETLGVHENTVRYRLARAEALLGLDIAASTKDQLSVQVALLVLRLDGRLPFPPE